LIVEEDRGAENVRELYDLELDPQEESPISNPAKEAELQAILDELG
jgi:hypothetical protein